MISIYEALSIIRSNIKRNITEIINITDSLGRIAAEDCHSNIDLPQLDNSAMDGWVFNIDALEKNTIDFEKKEIKAGDPKTETDSSKAYRIYTGGVVPNNLNTVAEKEIVELVENKLIINKKIEKKRNIRKKGEDIKKGDIVLKKGNYIDPYNLNLLISSGVNKIKVFKRPSIAIVSTGNELKEPGVKIKSHEVYDSNSYTVKALVKSMGIENIYLYRCKDTLEKTILTIKKALEYDIVLTIGGVSMGDYDFIRPALKELKCERLFWKLKLKPGRPFGFFKKNEKYIFTLPGNPVSSTVCFELFLRGTIEYIMGKDLCFKELRKGKALFDWKSKDDRIEFVRGILKDSDSGTILELAGKDQQSNMLFELSKANCLIKVESNSIKKGDLLEYIKLYRL
ncbi:MAG: hypothetical protein C0601_10350 [Candidatus Muiribacterium halophilum]|uniref:Molybdopterin molybdenumtransferase n=1 Tax=Muiribacterium halophilum TaxID=2053465 RepID=A0A2N5ZCF2_MUIH1|nr:MAG: hypothetical protein C0601_10350 [Candidatus Muirbacterium halophilum]